MNGFGISQSFSSWYGATIMCILILFSIYLVALIIVRTVFLKKASVDSSKLMLELSNALHVNDNKKLAELKTKRETDPPVRIVVSSALTNADLSNLELMELLKVSRIRQRERLTKGLGAFGTMATIAPFLGLLGTVLGIVESFTNLATTGAAGPNVVASGVAEALWATAAGLVVAIPAVVAHNVLKGKVKSIMTDLEVVSQELLIMLKMTRKAS